MAGGAQSAGNDLGETVENVPSLNAAVHPSAAEPGTDTFFNSEAQIEPTTKNKKNDKGRH